MEVCLKNTQDCRFPVSSVEANDVTLKKKKKVGLDFNNTFLFVVPPFKILPFEVNTNKLECPVEETGNLKVSDRCPVKNS